MLILSGTLPTWAMQAEVDTSDVSNWLVEAESEILQGEIKSAREKINNAEYWARELEFPKGVELAKLRLGDLYLNIQYYDSAKTVLQQAISDNSQSRYMRNYLNLLGTAYGYLNENQKAIETFEQALAILDTLRDKKSIIGINQNMGSVYENMGMKTETLSRYMKSVEFSEAIKDTAVLIVALNGLGNALNSFEEYEKATFYIERSIELAKVKNYRIDILRGLTNLAISKLSLGFPEEALKIYEETLSLSKEIRPNTPPFQLLFNIGNVHLKQGDTGLAKEYFVESLGYCEQFSIPEGIFYNSIGLGTAAEMDGDFRSASNWYVRGLEVAETYKIDQFQQEALQLLSESNKKLGNFEEALEYFERYSGLTDSLHNAEEEKEFAELINQLELVRQTEINKLLKEKQEQQERQLNFQYVLIVTAVIIILLILIILINSRNSNREIIKANTLLSTQRGELEKLNVEQNKLFAIIAHDLRSPLSSLKGMLYLLRKGNLTEEEFHQFTDELDHSIQSNIEVMEDLFSWAKDQMSGITLVNAHITVHPIIDQVISNQKRRAQDKGVSIINKIDAEATIIGDAYGVTLIFRNLLSNAVKFTNSGDSITFTSKVKGDFLELCVTDTGVGMSEETVSKLFLNSGTTFSNRGTLGERGTGFGLSIIQDFVTKQGGTIQVKSEENKGTEFCIRLKRH